MESTKKVSLVVVVAMVLVLVATFAPSAFARSNDNELSSANIADADANENGVTNSRRTSLSMIMLEGGLHKEGFVGSECGDSCFFEPCKDGCSCKTIVPIFKSRCAGSCCGTSTV